MKNDFRESGILRVRVMSAEEKERMYSLLRKLGFQDIPENSGQFYPRATNVYEIDISGKTARGVLSITACAGMASTGAMSVFSDFCRMIFPKPVPPWAC